MDEEKTKADLRTLAFGFALSRLEQELYTNCTVYFKDEAERLRRKGDNNGAKKAYDRARTYFDWLRMYSGPPGVIKSVVLPEKDNPKTARSSEAKLAKAMSSFPKKVKPAVRYLDKVVDEMLAGESVFGEEIDSGLIRVHIHATPLDITRREYDKLYELVAKKYGVTVEDMKKYSNLLL